MNALTMFSVWPPPFERMLIGPQTGSVKFSYRAV
jgi:hypothetical protein